MTVFEDIHSKNLNELVDWLDKHGAYSESPWERWFEKNYCKKCKPVVGTVSYLHGEHEFAWCELNHKCMYFQEMNKVPNRKQTIRLWLESEV